MKESPWKIRGLRGFQKGKVRIEKNHNPAKVESVP
jgi:hypothetical protein